MKSLRILVLAGLLTACDEATIITHVDKLSHMSMNSLVTIQGAQGIAVEIHGAPFPGIDDTAIAAAMRPPAGASQGIRFHAVEPGTWSAHDGWRLVLHFNPDGPPHSVHDCKLEAEAKTAGRPAQGYSVNATFCNGADWQAHGFLKAPKAAQDDPGLFADHMVQLMQAIFQENSDPDR